MPRKAAPTIGGRNSILFSGMCRRLRSSATATLEHTTEHCECHPSQRLGRSASTECRHALTIAVGIRLAADRTLERAGLCPVSVVDADNFCRRTVVVHRTIASRGAAAITVHATSHRIARICGSAIIGVRFVDKSITIVINAVVTHLGHAHAVPGCVHSL